MNRHRALSGILIVVAGLTTGGWQSAADELDTVRGAPTEESRERSPRRGGAAGVLRRMQADERDRVPGRYERRSRQNLQEFDEIVADAARSTVAIRQAAKQVALATVVTIESDRALLVTKASLLGEDLDALEVESMSERFGFQLVGVSETADLALIAVSTASGGEPFTACEWGQGELVPGQLLASPHPARKSSTAAQTMSAGVVSVAARKVLPRPGFLGIEPRDHADGGAVIAGLTPDSAAQIAGLRIRDVIVGLDQRVIEDVEDLLASLVDKPTGTEVEIKYIRDGAEKTTVTKLGSRGLSMTRLNRFELMNQMSGALSEVRHGFGSVVQHDMVIQPDACGGPIVDLSGKVVGINIARAGRTASYALPTKEVLKAITSLTASTTSLP